MNRATATRAVDTNIVETTYTGIVDRQHVDEVTVDVCSALAELGGGHWLADMTQVDGVRVAPEESLRFFTAFRAAGGMRIAVVGPAPVRLMAVALSFISGLDIERFASREEALKHLRSPTP